MVVNRPVVHRPEPKVHLSPTARPAVALRKELLRPAGVTNLIDQLVRSLALARPAACSPKSHDLPVAMEGKAAQHMQQAEPLGGPSAVCSFRASSYSDRWLFALACRAAAGALAGMALPRQLPRRQPPPASSRRQWMR